MDVGSGHRYSGAFVFDDKSSVTNIPWGSHVSSSPYVLEVSDPF